MSSLLTDNASTHLRPSVIETRAAMGGPLVTSLRLAALHSIHFSMRRKCSWGRLHCQRTTRSSYRTVWVASGVSTRRRAFSVSVSVVLAVVFSIALAVADTVADAVAVPDAVPDAVAEGIWLSIR